MHVPDGYITVATSATAGVVAVGGVGECLRRAGRSLEERQVPLAGLAAAFGFTVQMLNFPVAAGTTGHVIGGALIAVLVGPGVGVVVMTVVIALQALLFADGGVTALGLNIVNMGLVSVLVGWVVFRLVVGLLRGTATAVVVGTAVASWASVVAASAAFVVEYAVGGAGQVPVPTVMVAMVGVHALIGVGEGVIAASVVATVLAVRPDLVHGARVVGVCRAVQVRTDRRAVAAFVMGGVLAALALVVVAPHAATDPDGLERVAVDQGFAQDADPSALAGSALAEYRVAGVEDEGLSTVAAGAIGLAGVFVVGAGVLAVCARGGRRGAACVPGGRGDGE